MQACGAQSAVVARFKAAADGVYDAAREATRLRAFVTAGAIFLVFSSVVARFGSAPRMCWRAA